MKESTPDERLAALLDGNLGEHQRNELLAGVAASDDDYDVFVGAAAMLQEIEDDERAAGAPEKGVLPFRPRARRGWRAPARWGALAAAVGGIAFMATLAGRGRPAADPVRLAARLEHAGQGLPRGWAEETPWATVRGDAARGREPARAVGAGVLLMQLAVAVRGRDAEGTLRLARQMYSRFDSQAGPASPFRLLAQRAGAPPDSLRPLLARGTDRLKGRLGREPLELGVWLEAARLAAHRGDAAFFQAGETRRMLRAAERLAGDDAAARGALARVRGALPPEHPPRLDALGPALNALLMEIASGR